MGAVCPAAVEQEQAAEASAVAAMAVVVGASAVAPAAPRQGFAVVPGVAAARHSAGLAGDAATSKSSSRHN